MVWPRCDFSNNMLNITSQSNVSKKKKQITIINILQNKFNRARNDNDSDMTPRHHQRVSFNVSGASYETFENTLNRFPKTLLGDPTRRMKYYDETRGLYFFNRSRVAFDAVLFYYQSNGCLVRPLDLPMALFEYECIFYDLGENAIKNMKEREGYDSNKKLLNLSATNRSCHKLRFLWEFFEWPRSSVFARFYALISLLTIIFAVVMDCFETSPGLLVHQNEDDGKFDVWEIVKLSLNSFFAMEFILRLISAPATIRFITSKSNIIDFLAIFPYFVTFVNNDELIESMLFIRVLRTFRIFRLVRLSKTFETLSVVLHILSQSSSDLLTLIFCMLISCVVFGGAIYYTELGTPNTQITSIPEGMWLAMQTVVTIGYGDIVPLSMFGKIATAATAVVGALTMTVPLLSLGGRYFSIYTKTFDVTLNADLINTPGPGVIKNSIKK